MVVNATEFKMRVGKYLKIAQNEEIIITKNGKQIVKVIPIKDKSISDVDFLYGLMKNYSDKKVTIKDIRSERIKKYEGSN